VHEFPEEKWIEKSNDEKLRFNEKLRCKGPTNIISVICKKSQIGIGACVREMVTTRYTYS